MQALPVLGAVSVLVVKSLRDGAEKRRRLQIVMDEYRDLFDTPTERLLALRDALVEQLEAGLAGQVWQPGGLMALPSYVDVLPSGHEQGHCYAIDLGGTNLRVAHVHLGQGRGETVATHIREWEIPEEHFDVDRGTLLRFVAQRTAEVVREHSGSSGEGGRPVVGFCFSFPVDQTALDNGKVVVWTKNFRGTHLVGQDVVAVLRAELAAEGLDADVPAIMNDTVATLVALRYSQPDTQLGIILGTGTNCAYLERAAAIGKLPPGYRGRAELMVVNSEWGDFSSPLLPTSEEDVWVDCSSAHPGNGLFEKQISGLYLGEVARRIVLRLAEKEHLFGKSVGLLPRHFQLSTADMAAMDEDDSPDLQTVAAVLDRALEIRGTTKQQRQIVREVCQLVCLRSARLCAAGIAGMLKRMAAPGPAEEPASDAAAAPGGTTPRPVVVAIDGSVFAKYGKYRERLRAGLEDVCGKAVADSIQLQLAKDGSVLGAAYLGVAAAQFEQH